MICLKPPIPEIYLALSLSFFWGSWLVTMAEKASYLLARSPPIGLHTLNNDRQIRVIAILEETVSSNPITHAMPH
jgi:hypothetical protein